MASFRGLLLTLPKTLTPSLSFKTSSVSSFCSFRSFPSHQFSSFHQGPSPLVWKHSSPPFKPFPPFHSNQIYLPVRNFVERERRRTRTKTQVKDEEEEQTETQTRHTTVAGWQQEQSTPSSWRDYVRAPSEPAQPQSTERQSASLTPPVVQYMRKVWGYTGAALGIATISAGIGMMTPLVAVHPLIWGLASFVPLFTFYRSQTSGTRLASYLGFVGLTGLTLSSLLKISLAVNPMLPIIALAITSGITFAMTALSFLVPRGSFLRFGGALFAGCIGLIAAAILGIWFPLFHTIWLYGGILLFSAFLGWENQKTINDFENGLADPLHHSLGFFIDIVGLFRHILFLLLSRE